MKQWERRVIDRVVAPIVERVLKPFTAEDMVKAIEGRRDLAAELRKPENQAYRQHLLRIVASIPFSERAAPYFSREEYVRYILRNHVAHKLPDIYVAVAYHPDGFKYLIEQLKNLSKTLFW